MSHDIAKTLPRCIERKQRVGGSADPCLSRKATAESIEAGGASLAWNAAARLAPKARYCTSRQAGPANAPAWTSWLAGNLRAALDAPPQNGPSEIIDT